MVKFGSCVANPSIIRSAEGEGVDMVMVAMVVVVMAVVFMAMVVVVLVVMVLVVMVLVVMVLVVMVTVFNAHIHTRTHHQHHRGSGVCWGHGWVVLSVS